MTAANWPDIANEILAQEGGYVNNPADPGGATNMGVTLATLSAWRKATVSAADVKALTRTEAVAIFRANYWDKVDGDNLPSGIDLCVVDYAVNSGPARAVKALQQAVGAVPDGVMGAKTLAAVMTNPRGFVITKICAERLAFLKSLSTYAVFGTGWSRRVATIQTKALTMAAIPPTAPIPYPPLPKPTPVPAKPPAAGKSWVQALIAFIVSLFARKA